MAWQLVLTTLLQLLLHYPATARIHGSDSVLRSRLREETGDTAAASHVKLQVDGNDEIVVKHAAKSDKKQVEENVTKASQIKRVAQIKLQRAAPDIATGLPPSAVSLGVQEAEHHQIHHRSNVTGRDAAAAYRNVATTDGSWSHGREFRTFNMAQWKLIPLVLVGCLLANFLMGPMFGCVSLLCDIKFVQIHLSKLLEYAKDTSDDGPKRVGEPPFRALKESAIHADCRL